MNYNKNTYTFLSLLLLTTGQRERNIEKTLFVSAGAQKRWKTGGSGSTLPQYLPNPKSKFYIYINYICLTFNSQKKLKQFH